MPFELGIAFALKRIDGHKFVLLEAKRHRLQKTLSDTNGIDPGIHDGTATGMISCVLSSLAKPTRNPEPGQIERRPSTTLENRPGPQKTASSHDGLLARSIQRARRNSNPSCQEGRPHCRMR
jgi:hypothetical protein